MKVYYQTDGYSTCYVAKLFSLELIVEQEIDEFFFDDEETTEARKDEIYLEILEKVKSGGIAEFNGFKFGSTDMPKAEFEELDEFMGW